MPIKMDKMIPPGVHEILDNYLDEGTQWYEIRSGALGFYSYPLDEYDTALAVTRSLNMHSVQLFYVWVEKGEIRDRQVY